MDRPVRFVLAFGLILFAVSVWSYRVHAATDAVNYAPATAGTGMVSAGTEIRAVSRTKIPSSITVGDAITIFVSDAVTIAGTVEIPVGSQLNGKVKTVVITGKTAEVRMTLTRLVVQGRSVSIQARGMATDAPLESDLENIQAGLRTLASVALGASIGAASGDPRLLDRGLMEGSRNSLTKDKTIPIIVILEDDLEISST